MITIPDRALSIRQPWADLIMSGNKLVENRTWKTKFRGTFVVHAGQKIDRRGLVPAAEFGIGLDPMPTGYLGLVDLVGIHFADGHCCPAWGEPNAFHWQLDNPRPFPAPISGPGRLALYKVPATVRDAITAAQEVA